MKNTQIKSHSPHNVSAHVCSPFDRNCIRRTSNTSTVCDHTRNRWCRFAPLLGCSVWMALRSRCIWCGRILAIWSTCECYLSRRNAWCANSHPSCRCHCYFYRCLTQWMSPSLRADRFVASSSPLCDRHNYLLRFALNACLTNWKRNQTNQINTVNSFYNWDNMSNAWPFE